MFVALGSVAEYIPALACPALMFLCMRGLRGRSKPDGQQAPPRTSAERRQALQVEMRQLDKERLARGEITPEEYLRLHGPECGPPGPVQGASPARATGPAAHRAG